MADKIFINYRRDNSIGTADRLAQAFVRFIGVRIPAGADFWLHEKYKAWKRRWHH